MKPLFLSLLLFTLSLHQADGQSYTNPPSGLILWLQGEGNTLDQTGNYPGSAEGGLTYSKGQVGQCFVFNGTDAAVALGSWFNLQKFTLSLWVNPSPSQVTFADLMDDNHNSSISWPIQYQNSSSGGSGLWQWGPNGGGFLNFNLQIGSWQHLVIARDDTNSTILYLNGVAVGTNTNYGPIPYDGTQVLHLGRHQSLGRYFAGLVDELMVFNRALSAGEISSLYASQAYPALSIASQTNVVTVSWSGPVSGWVLEHANLLGSNPPWTQFPLPYQTNGLNVSTQLTNASRTNLDFFRLHKP